MPRPTAASEFFTVPAGTPSTTCRGPNCQKRMYWIHDSKTGRAICVDCDVEGGESPSTTKDRGQLDAFSSQEAPVHDGRGVRHHTTCVDVDMFRTSRHD
jgi:hypothetical protein